MMHQKLLLYFFNIFLFFFLNVYRAFRFLLEVRLSVLTARTLKKLDTHPTFFSDDFFDSARAKLDTCMRN